MSINQPRLQGRAFDFSMRYAASRNSSSWLIELIYRPLWFGPRFRANKIAVTRDEQSRCHRVLDIKRSAQTRQTPASLRCLVCRWENHVGPWNIKRVMHTIVSCLVLHDVVNTWLSLEAFRRRGMQSRDKTSPYICI